MIIVFRKKFFVLCLVFLFCVTCTLKYVDEKHQLLPTMAENKSYIAIVIDDFGYDGVGTKEMLELDVDITAAIMPFSSNTENTVETVANSGKEMIVHMPMESLTGKPSWVGDKAIRTTLSDDEIKVLVEEALDTVKYSVGLNNHMGSKIMEDERSLDVVIKVLAERNLVFLDSKTTEKSVAKKLCDDNGVEFLERDVFLDSTDSLAVVKEKLKKAEEIALKDGFALAIGHVGPEGGKITAQAIKELAPQMKNKGIEFVTLSQYGKLKKANSNN